MSDFVDKLKLAEKAAEDIYFAKVNRELIDALHKRMQVEEKAGETDKPAHANDLQAKS